MSKLMEHVEALDTLCFTCGTYATHVKTADVQWLISVLRDLQRENYELISSLYFADRKLRVLQAGLECAPQ